MELDFDADFVEADEESLGTLVRRKSKVDQGRNLKENVANGTVKPEVENDYVTSGGGNIDINEAINLQDEEGNQTCERETKMSINLAASDDKFTSTVVLSSSELNTGGNLEENIVNGRKIMNNIKIGFNNVQNREVKPGGETSDAVQSQVTMVEHTERHGNKEYYDGGSTAYSLSMDPSNKSSFLTGMPVKHLKAKLVSSVYYAEDKGLWKCRHCSWVYPVTNPGIKLIEKHKEHCEGMNNENMSFEDVFSIKHKIWKGSQINANLGRGSETVDNESKETEFVTSEMVSQTMAQKQNDQKWPTTEGIWQNSYTDSETSTGAYVTQSFVTGKFNQIENINNGKSAFLDLQIFSDTGSTANVRNGGPMSNEGQEKIENSGIKEHQHWNGVSKTFLQKSQEGFAGAKDEKQLRENEIRILEKNALEGKVEDIVKILKEQQSHDLVCPNCGSCITKRVILRKRKRTSVVSDGNADVEAAVSEEEHEITEDQRNRSEMPIEHGEETEAYGCLTCFSLFFIRGVKFFLGDSSAVQYSSGNLQDSRMLIDKEKDSFHCFPFLYPWGHSTADSKADDAIETSQRTNGKQAESIPSTVRSESQLGMDDTLHQKPATSIGTGSLLKNDGEKATTVNEVGIDEYRIVAGNVKLDHHLNVSDKDDAEVKEFSPNDKPGQAEATFEVPNESVSEKKSDIPVTAGQLTEVPHGMSDTAGIKGLPSSEQHPDDLERDMVVGKSQIVKKDNLCNCIPVSIPSFWSWSSKKLITDEELKKPLLPGLEDRQIVDTEAPLESRGSSVINPDSRNTVSPSGGRAATVINIVQLDGSQPEITGTSISVVSERPTTEVVDHKVVTDWDLLKSIVYGGLTVSITSLGVVSSAAGGEANTLTVIAISLANLVAGFFLIITNILYLGHFHQTEFTETVGHRFWFNGFIAILSYLIFGSLAPITYGFSFRKSGDTMYKFLAASLVSLISIILLASGKARVTTKSYIKIIILYVVTGFWASFIGFFAGKYIKKLLEKWGFTTD